MLGVSVLIRQVCECVYKNATRQSQDVFGLELKLVSIGPRFCVWETAVLAFVVTLHLIFYPGGHEKVNHFQGRICRRISRINNTGHWVT